MQGKYAAVRQVIRQTYPCSMRILGAEEPESDMISFLEVAPGGELEDDKDRRLYLCGKWGVCAVSGVSASVLGTGPSPQPTHLGPKPHFTVTVPPPLLFA